MISGRLSLFLFPALLLVAAVFALRTVGDLPEMVAFHFGANGVADGWMKRDRYGLLMLSFLVGVPALLVWVMAGLPRLTNGKGQIPNNDYWFAAERRPATEAFLLRHSCWLGCLTVAVVYGAHVLILRANAVTPPALSSDRFVVMVAAYLAGLTWWIITLMRHFQRPIDRGT
jgi:uncharacterized membrane protein